MKTNLVDVLEDEEDIKPSRNNGKVSPNLALTDNTQLTKDFAGEFNSLRVDRMGDDRISDVFKEKAKIASNKAGMTIITNGAKETKKENDSLRINHPTTFNPLEPVPTGTIKLLKTQVLSKLRRNSQLLYGLDDHYRQVYSLCKHCLDDLQSRSLLLMGPRNTGKTSLVNQVLSELEKEHPKGFITIKLNGIFQTDDRKAVREFAHQLDIKLSQLAGYDTILDRIVSKDKFVTVEKKNITHTLESILRILDSKRLQQNSEDEIKGNNIPIIVILETFEVFVNQRQSFLYNLLDITQNGSSPMSVIGITNKLNTRELLEKRVKSRFSQRILQFNKATSLEEFSSMCLVNLLASVPKDEQLDAVMKSYFEAYNSRIQELLTTSSPLRQKLVEIYYTTRDIVQFKLYCVPIISQLSELSPLPGDFASVNSITSLLRPMYLEDIILKGLSELEIQLLISASRVVKDQCLENVNFNLVYEEYSKLIKKFQQERISQMSNFQSSTGVVASFNVYEKFLMEKCWETLITKNLLLDINVSSRNTNKSQTFMFNNNISSRSVKFYYLNVTLEELSEILDRNWAKWIQY
ncbi:BA75_02595T0 [Komagataella pastoris]|uniref:Origin recognition complex subunit 4 n=1 Tax=Komagataella pastoris TaxID=4922 RepID=A0A1B2JD74_PICPA|nr:BA75_02595T0 [Komagataella pastoris]